MRLPSGMEAWPQSRLGDNARTIGTVSQIKPTVPNTSRCSDVEINVKANNKTWLYNNPRK